MNTDLTFFTNEPERTLVDRFKSFLKDVKYFDILVGYFRSSGFFQLYNSFEGIEKIRILVGLNIDKITYKIVEKQKVEQQLIDFETHKKTQEFFGKELIEEVENTPDDRDIELGIKKFCDYINSGKIEIKAHPSRKIHAKLYISRYKNDDRDFGNVITGSSNFSELGLVGNYEFNVQLKNRSDVEFALDKFEKFWAESVDISEYFVDTIKEKTYLTEKIKPYELYLKLLYEYFKEDLSIDRDLFYKNIPKNFMKLEYQEQAVVNAKKIIDAYGGVFLSDVVGLGKTYIAAMLANQLQGRHLVIASPALLDKTNPNSWTNVFFNFHISAQFESIGKLHTILENGIDKFDNVFIDEAHKFRNENTVSYETLMQICSGKRVILVTATPLNNQPADILAQLKLFQRPQNSTIPGVKNLEYFFGTLQKRLKNLDRKHDYEEYMNAVKDISQKIRERVLKYVMVRRTRNEIKKYFEEDLKVQGLKFPEVEPPQPIYYQLDNKLDNIFMQTIKLIADEKSFTYSRYAPLLYLKQDLKEFEKTAQKNMRGFMKILLIKRLESSFYAFKQTVTRFIKSYKNFLEAYQKGQVFFSKKDLNKVIDFFLNEDFEGIQKLLDDEKIEMISSNSFKPELETDLKKDIETLQYIKKLWADIDYDPKLDEFIKELKQHKELKNPERKIILFTESTETAEYLTKNIKERLAEKIILYHGAIQKSVLKTVIQNFDAKAIKPENEYRLLITTEILSEGVNLHRSNIVVNYDIPWNPTRMIQRVGRINRVDTNFDRVFTFNFFPTQQSNDLIKLKEAAQYKIQYFIEMLGNDASLLTDGEEIKSHELFNKLTSKEFITGEDTAEDSELKYFKVIADIQENNKKLFNKIKVLPKKSRVARIKPENILTEYNTLITYFRKGNLDKFYKTDETDITEEIGFLTAAKFFECEPETRRKNMPDNFYDLLSQNKNRFVYNLSEEEVEVTFSKKGGRDYSVKLLKIIKTIQKIKSFTEIDDDFLKDLNKLLSEGGLPKKVAKRVYELVENENDPKKILTNLRTNVSDDYFNRTPSAKEQKDDFVTEVILSEYLIKE